MADHATSCPSCGAHVPEGKDRCDLCGARIDHDRTDAPTETEATPGSQPTAPDNPPGEATGDDPSTDSPVESDANAESNAGSASDGGEGASPDDETEPEERPEPAEAEAEPSGVYCNQCGWKNPTGANFCSRCGTELQAVESAPESSRAKRAEAGSPEGARPVQADLPSGAAPTSEDAAGEDAAVDEQADAIGDKSPEESQEETLMGQRLTLVVGSAVGIVLVLFFVTLWSQSQSWGSGDESGSSSAQTPAAQSGPVGGSGGRSSGSGGPAAGSGGGAGGSSALQRQDLSALAEETSGEIPSSVADQVDSLRTRLEEVSGIRARRVKAQLVNLYIGAGETARAAVLQQEVASAANDTDEWRRAANLFYQWMQQLSSQQNRQQAFQVASQAALAYEKVVAEEPGNLDARTRMGETYLLTNNPMKGIEAINGVLEDDSTFVPARFQKGLALLQINRLDPAIQQFEQVKRYAEEGSGFYQQADRAIQIIQERSGGGSGGGAAGPTRPSGN